MIQHLPHPRPVLSFLFLRVAGRAEVQGRGEDGDHLAERAGRVAVAHLRQGEAPALHRVAQLPVRAKGTSLINQRGIHRSNSSINKPSRRLRRPAVAVTKLIVNVQRAPGTDLIRLTDRKLT